MTHFRVNVTNRRKPLRLVGLGPNKRRDPIDGRPGRVEQFGKRNPQHFFRRQFRGQPLRAIGDQTLMRRHRFGQFFRKTLLQRQIDSSVGRSHRIK